MSSGGKSDRLRQRFASNDEEVLASLGYRQELKRDFSWGELLGLSFSIIGVVQSIAAVLVYSLPNGGAAAMVWGWAACCVLIMSIAFSMAELASAAPTTGGLYYWSFKFSSPKYQKVLSWIVGYSNSIGYGVYTFYDTALCRISSREGGTVHAAGGTRHRGRCPPRKRARRGGIQSSSISSPNHHHGLETRDLKPIVQRLPSALILMSGQPISFSPAWIQAHPDTFLNTDWVNVGHLQQWLDENAPVKCVKQGEDAASTAFDASKSLENTPKLKPEPFDIELTRRDTAGDIKIRDIQRDRNP
ncbi:unnamed protein product [Cyclocybe aegerita]|uniref:Uncharacterized protein n=1 Tax=Cyclocybe aegerita TaxID=1973307 RepID=A0A8S0XSY9_CYCAE|nr:unnamed protein product [Cyclocybe aegerita]